MFGIFWIRYNLYISFAGFYKKYFLVTQHTQYNLETMEKLRPDDCILVDNLSQGSIVFKMEWVLWNIKTYQ